MFDKINGISGQQDFFHHKNFCYIKKKNKIKDEITLKYVLQVINSNKKCYIYVY